MNKNGIVILGVIVVVAVVALLGVIILSNNANAGPQIDFSQIPQSRAEDGAFVLGNPDAPVTLVEFADFVCPHCVTYEKTALQFIQDFVVTGQAKFEYRMFPTAGGDLSRFAGQIAECAEEQQSGGFWKAYALLYDLAETGQYNQELGQRVANALGLSYAELLNCSTTAQQVTTDVAFGRDQGVEGTPAVRVRYGDGPAQIITVGGQSVTAGGASYEQLAQFVQAANQQTSQ
ncbi:MAG: thioredoxin domain-containing protein [Anaerolineae bacterium]